MVMRRLLATAMRRLVAVALKMPVDARDRGYAVRTHSCDGRFTGDRAEAERHGCKQNECALNHGALASSKYGPGKADINSLTNATARPGARPLPQSEHPPTERKTLR